MYVLPNQIFDFDNSSTPARTYTNTYLTNSNYTPTANWSAMAWETAQALYNGTSLNQGDINLGEAAAFLGAQLKKGLIGTDKIAGAIKELCAK